MFRSFGIEVLLAIVTGFLPHEKSKDALFPCLSPPVPAFSSRRADTFWQERPIHLPGETFPTAFEIVRRIFRKTKDFKLRSVCNLNTISFMKSSIRPPLDEAKDIGIWIR